MTPTCRILQTMRHALQHSQTTRSFLNLPFLVYLVSLPDWQVKFHALPRLCLERNRLRPERNRLRPLQQKLLLLVVFLCVRRIGKDPRRLSWLRRARRCIASRELPQLWERARRQQTFTGSSLVSRPEQVPELPRRVSAVGGTLRHLLANSGKKPHQRHCSSSQVPASLRVPRWSRLIGLVRSKLLPDKSPTSMDSGKCQQAVLHRDPRVQGTSRRDLVTDRGSAGL